MGGLNIRLRIWLSIGIFVFGYLLSTAVDYLGRLRNEQDLRVVSDVLIPAAENGHSAKSAFIRLLKEYEENSVVENPPGLGQAAVETARTLECLNAIARSPVDMERSSTALRLASAIRRFSDEANIAYARVPTGSDTIRQALQDKRERLENQAAELDRDLGLLDRDLTSDLDARIRRLRSRSAQIRLFALILFAATVIVAAIVVNITIQRSIMRPLSKVQSELADERDLLRILLDHIPDYIYFKHADGKYIRINKALASLFGLHEPEAARGRSDADYFDSDTAARILADDRKIFLSDEPVIGKIEQVARSGVSRWVTTTKVPVQTPSARLIVGISRDITEWKQAIEELGRSETSFRLLFSAIPHAIFVCDAETLEILEVNDAATRTYGYSSDEFHAMHLSEIYAPEDRVRLKRTLHELGPAKPWRGLSKHWTKDGRILDVEIVDHFLEFHGRQTILVMAQDVSEQKRLEIELQHAQRLEAVGQLAAGIAHEINTPIQYVGDNLRFICDAFKARQEVFAQFSRLLEAASAGEITAELIGRVKAVRDQADLEYLECEIPKALEQSLDGVDRVATIVRAMKSFAHPGSNEKMPADLNKALSDALIVAHNELKYVADVVTDFAELPPVSCQLADLNQVFLNLLVNAAHAIGDVVKKSGVKGEIRLQTRCENNEVTISISDTGCGIPREIQSRVFDPFFTTKEVGKGTGQGLAIARNIVVEKHGGRITFEPNFPQGTTFLVSLPINGPRVGAEDSVQTPAEAFS